ncbi:MAG: MFS transporter [Candidatus Hodarchaeota archaeon]
MASSKITQKVIGFFNLNRNIQIAFIQSFFSSVGMGIAMGVMPVFIAEMTSIQLLGWIVTAGGIASTLILFPSGFLADFWRRDVLIIVGGFLAAIGFSLIVFANSFEQILFAQIMLGLSQGVSGAAVEALIADSTETGVRSKVYSQLYFVRSVFSAVGPFIGFLLVIVLGDYWGIEVLRNILFFGALIWGLSFISTFFVRDRFSLGKESESESLNAIQDDNEIARSEFKVPLVLIISGIIIGMGAGMTVQYFALFFKDPILTYKVINGVQIVASPGYALRPSIWYLILGTTQIISGFTGILAQRLSKRIGRVEIMFSFQGIAIIALIMIIPNPVWAILGNILGFPEWAIVAPLIAVVFLYIFRNAFMNASNPLGRTIVMDKIAKKHRGKWNALEQLAWGFLWAFSAGIGGELVTRWGYYVCYIVTATLYTIATLILLLIRKDVRKERER